MEKKIRVAVIDDHEFFRRGVVSALKRIKFTELAFEATSGEEFIEKIKNEAIDIALIDIKMPGINGIEATREAINLHPNLKIIALSMFGEEQYLEEMIEAGCSGFLLKNIDKEGLSRALEMVAEGKQYFSEELLPHFIKKMKPEPIEDELADLTKREIEILQLIAKGNSNKEIADQLNISLRTVTNHRANINFKTDSKNTASLILYAIKNNLVQI